VMGAQAAKPPTVAERGGEFGMELKTPPRQGVERAAAAPVERKEAARFAGSRTGDGVSLDHGRPRAASAREIGDRGADCATATDHDARGRTHAQLLCQAWRRDYRAAHAARASQPVALPPGRARLATRPSLTGSSGMVKTIGIVVVAALAASAGSEPPVATITATCRRINSVTRAGTRS